MQTSGPTWRLSTNSCTQRVAPTKNWVTLHLLGFEIRPCLHAACIDCACALRMEPEHGSAYPCVGNPTVNRFDARLPIFHLDFNAHPILL